MEKIDDHELSALRRAAATFRQSHSDRSLNRTEAARALRDLGSSPYLLCRLVEARDEAHARAEEAEWRLQVVTEPMYIEEAKSTMYHLLCLKRELEDVMARYGGDTDSGVDSIICRLLAHEKAYQMREIELVCRITELKDELEKLRKE